MAELVNLKQARRARDRAAAEASAAANRARHGRSKADKLADRKAAEIVQKRIDGAKLDRPDQEIDPVKVVSPRLRP